MENTQVLITGAGPSGLALALWLTRMGIRIRIIDKTAEAGTTSRATVFHARNLEFYQQLGIAEKAIAGGIKMNKFNVWAKGKRTVSVAFGRSGEGLSPYPYALIFPQDKHEKMLIAELEVLGIRVERETELLSFEQETDKVTATIHYKGNTEKMEVLYLAGCDGAHSVVRKQLGIDFPGGEYAMTAYVADVECAGPVADGQMHAALDKADFFIVFPMKDHGNVRLIGTVKHEGRDLHWEDVHTDILARMQVKVNKVNWFSTYRVHHRVAAQFRKDRVFLLGDAGHIHSPVGGQGMNTGIGDAINLAWKLRDVINGDADAILLDTYETERIAFARQLVNSTDRAFTFVTARGPLANFIRLFLVPIILPIAFGFAAIRRIMFRTMSQIQIRYPQSPLSSGKAGRIRGGDRLPWTGDNFESLKTLNWQVHVYGRTAGDLPAWCDRKGLTLSVYEWSIRSKKAGFKKDAVYLVRPDGYVALVQPNLDIAALHRFLDPLYIHS